MAAVTTAGVVTAHITTALGLNFKGPLKFLFKSHVLKCMYNDSFRKLPSHQGMSGVMDKVGDTWALRQPGLLNQRPKSSPETVSLF